MGKYEYLSGQDLGYKLDVIQRAKFEYSPFGEAFNKVFERDDKNKKIISEKSKVKNLLHKEENMKEKDLKY